MVVQKAERKGSTVVGGRMERREARSVARRCWVRGRSESHMPVWEGVGGLIGG